jgi:putative transcription factor
MIWHYNNKMLPHQDWNRISFTGPTNKQRKGEKAVQDAHRRGTEVEVIRKNTKNANHKLPSKLRNVADENEIIAITELPYDFRIAMQKARVAANLSQSELAKKINEKQNIVNEYESGRAVPDIQIIVKIERALNCRLPRPCQHNR